MKASRKTATGTLLIVLFVAGAVLAVVAWSGADGSGGARSAGPVPGLPEEVTQSSATPGDDARVIALPPVGAAPSTPEHGELLVSLDARPGTGFPQRFVPVHQVWVYSDGRVVWRREDGPFGVNGLKTGLLEQRLTVEAIGRLRAELLSTGLFDRDRILVSERGLSWGEIEVQDDDQLVSVVWCCGAISGFDSIHGVPGLEPARPTSRQTSALIRIGDLLADLTSQLPARAWEDREVRAYVPSRYAICYRGTNDRGIGYASLEPSRVLSELPARASDLLRGNDKRYDIFTPLLAKSESPEHAPCSEVAIEDARALEEILRDEGFERSFELPPLAVSYRAELPSPIGELTISFEPLLPHGQWEPMGG